MDKLERSGIGYINMMAGTVLGHVVCFYLFAWRFGIIAPWIYFGAYVLIQALTLVILYKYNRPLLNERGKNKADVKKEDRIIIPFMLAFTYFLPSIAAGIEYRLHAIQAIPVLLIIGLLLLLFSGVLENWAMLTNTHFETRMRIQHDRHHAVVTDGPYKYMRHPGYLSYIIRLIALPLMLGSVWSVIPVIVGIVIYVIRTSVEDAALLRELIGYREYAETTRYRLIPFIW